MPDSSHQVLGTRVSMPVHIRSARCFVAGFTASESAVRSAIASRGDVELAPLRVRPGRAMCMLVFVDYVDGDLGPYNEFGVCFLVQDPDRAAPSPLRALGSLVKGDAHALIHELPVDGEFTLAAGRGIWGFPKVLADFDVDHDSATKTGRVSQEGKLIVDLAVRRGIGVPDSTSEAVLQSYAQLDAVTRRTPWRLTSTTGTRTRIGGATLRLGDHPMADELRRLQLSRHALMTSSVENLSMVFEDAVDIG
ncbi:acetoacetate decarboxylase family protein [Gordonia liuliyuniae]|uniref:Acetoacetate decarboxylase family protein n=1 Tax=Gordonia liuliyuniae TaxID=2911517 RepID=A0ABS9IN54_9ACTN|nr:acetoacetate decarboxylase family protein [Gordonia liuliyuniae]MCF8586982.1 acetoacetate decarboxylase family protein [Gordonia liuliyuniae]